MSNAINITFSTCLYNLKNRHGTTLHNEWMRGFIRIINWFFLVIYTDEKTYDLIYAEVQKLDSEIANTKIKIVVKPYANFYNYKHEKYWINNNANPECKLANIADWRLNMLWCEKVHFVNETIERMYFDTEYYGWCDIGYFRDTLSASGTSHEHTEFIRASWPNPVKINAMDKTKVYYGCNSSPDQMNMSLKHYSEHFHPSNLNNKTGIRLIKYNKSAHLISGGFFITSREKMKWWVHTFQSTLEKYILHNSVIQDDQQLIAECVFTQNNGLGSGKDFCITKVNETAPDKLWFMFRELLL